MKIKLNKNRLIAGMIHFVSGKPGGGKSLYAVRLILDELVCGQRHIYTNLALRLGVLSQYVQEHYAGRCSGGVVNRVHLLTEDELPRFWLHRPGLSRPINFVGKEKWKNGERPDYSGVSDFGVMYVLDEAHTAFSARNWQSTADDVLYYISQHRKLGDTVLVITQSIQNVDAQFRSVAQDFTQLRNFAKEKWGFFRPPGLFIRRTFISPPTDLSVPVETGSFKLDVSGLAACYDTAVGVGIHGRSADAGEKRKGLPWFTVPLFLLFFVLILFGPARSWATHIFSNRIPVTVSSSVHNVQPAAARTDQTTPQANRPAAVQASGPVVTGYSIFGGKIYYTLSDGTVSVITTNGTYTYASQTIKHP